MRRLGVAATALAGALAGAAVVLSLPTRGVPLEPVSPRPRVPRGAVLGEAPIPTLLAWTPGGLPEGFAAAVRDLPGVRAAAEVRSGVAWLDAWGDRSGERRSPPRGFRVPVEVAAIDPRGYQAFVPPADRPPVAALGRRDALLGSTAAELRGIGEGGSLRFGRTSLEVGGVLDDELVGAHEVVVSYQTGARLGIVRPRYLLVASERRAAPRRVEERIRDVLPAGTRVRIRAPGETPVFRHGDAVLPPVRLKELFGEFAAVPAPGGFLRPDPRWVREHIRTAHLPILGEVRCHRLVIPLARAALADLARRGLGDLLDPADFGGCYSPRFIARDPGAGLSHHAWGIALDVNVSQNPLGAEPSQDRRVVDAFERWGFTWGGRWLVPDGMHFEFLRFPVAE